MLVFSLVGRILSAFVVVASIRWPCSSGVAMGFAKASPLPAPRAYFMHPKVSFRRKTKEVKQSRHQHRVDRTPLRGHLRMRARVQTTVRIVGF